MSQGVTQVVYPVKDVAQATKLYSTLLGVEPYVSTPYYVGYRVGDQEIGLDPNGHSNGLTGPIGYYEVSDINATIQQLIAAGGQTQTEPYDVGNGLLIAWVKDVDGNLIGLKQP